MAALDVDRRDASMNLRCACGWTAGDWSEVSGHWATLADPAGHNVHDVAAMSDESVLTALDRHNAREAADASTGGEPVMREYPPELLDAVAQTIIDAHAPNQGAVSYHRLAHQVLDVIAKRRAPNPAQPTRTQEGSGA